MFVQTVFWFTDATSHQISSRTMFLLFLFIMISLYNCYRTGLFLRELCLENINSIVMFLKTFDMNLYCYIQKLHISERKFFSFPR